MPFDDLFFSALWYLVLAERKEKRMKYEYSNITDANKYEKEKAKIRKIMNRKEKERSRGGRGWGHRVTLFTFSNWI